MSSSNALAPRELEVLRQVADGATNKAIGATLGLDEKTVKNYLTLVFEKLGVVNRAQAAAYYVRFVEPGTCGPCLVQERGGRHCSQEAPNV